MGEGNKDDRDRFFSVLPRDKRQRTQIEIREIVLKQKKKRLLLMVFGLGYFGVLFTMRVVGHWKRLPREVVKASFLEVFRALAGVSPWQAPPADRALSEEDGNHLSFQRCRPISDVLGLSAVYILYLGINFHLNDKGG